MEKHFTEIIKKLEEITFPTVTISINQAEEIVQYIQNLFFFANDNQTADLLDAIFNKVESVFHLTEPAAPKSKLKKDALTFLHTLPSIKASLVSDIKKAYKEDPSATSYEEIIVAYPGILAIIGHRIAHEIYLLHYPIVARTISEYVHRYTAIDIHPGATIGDSFFIDHGTGTVIGETTVIGNNVSVYHGVTFGVLSFDKDQDGNIIRGTKRHPTIEDNVTIYANSMVLGGNTVVGHDSVIGSGIVVTSSVEPYTKLNNKKAT